MKYIITIEIDADDELQAIDKVMDDTEYYLNHAEIVDI